MLAAAGCQSGDAGGVLGFGGGANEKKPEEGKVLASELLAYCPKVIVKEQEGAINRYAKGGEGDAAKLAWQAAISESTRSCNRQTGMLAMNVAVAGRVVTGPAGASGSITVPIKVSVVRGDGEVLYSKIHNHPIALSGNQAQQFLFNDPNVVVPIPEDKTLQVFAGFDAGPVKKKQEEEEAF
jgi:hypothetical protein